MACNHLLEEDFANGIFFAPPASPWLRGTNENINGLLCKYFLKRTGLRSAAAAHLCAVEGRIIGRPRQRLAWRSPARLMEAELAGATRHGCDEHANPPWNPPVARGQFSGAVEITRPRFSL